MPKEVTRPTTDRVREALFSILGQRVVDARVLDLFAGSGALGIEALSRGALEAIFVEYRAAACAVIESNLARTGLEGGSVLCTEVDAFFKRRGGHSWSLVFADPPYRKGGKGVGDPDPAADLLRVARLRERVEEGWLLVLESASEAGELETGSLWTLADERVYGGTRISLLSPAEFS
ncbi:MAG: 16S rRNA (guanine(966)-N(2))-methyltransferase RsmD [Verrucomicrobiales bacterium]